MHIKTNNVIIAITVIVLKFKIKCHLTLLDGELNLEHNEHILQHRLRLGTFIVA